MTAPQEPQNLLVLAAGYATRMGALSDDCAKPLMEVAGRPAVDWLLNRFLEIPRVGRTVVLSNSKFVDDFHRWQAGFNGSDVQLVENGSLTKEDKRGAIGDLQFGLEAGELFGDDLIVVGGDNLFEFPPRGFLEFARDKPVVIGTYDVGSPEEVRRFASIETDSDGLITAFEEKPVAPRGTVAGIALYWLRRDILPLVREYLDEGNNPDQAGHLIAWLRERVATYGCPVGGRWFDIGDRASLAGADEFFRGQEIEVTCAKKRSRT